MRVMCCRLKHTRVSQDLQVLVVALEEDLGLGCCPSRICRQMHSSYGLQELGDAQMLLFHRQVSLFTLLTKPSSCSSKNTMAILRPRASPS